MIYRFNHDVLSNLETASSIEWLESNRLGAYASSTITGMDTRREHGLLAVPHQGSNKKAVIISKFEESVFIDNHLFDISTNQYRDIVFPEGYKYLDRFEIRPFPRFVFRVDDRLIQKTLFLLENRNILIIRYELKNQGRPIKLILKPFLSGRLNINLADDLQGLNTDTFLGQHFVRWAPKVNMPQLIVYYNRGEFISASLWYHNFYYPKDLNRFGYASEDMFNPGFFQVTLKAYESLDLYLSPEEIDDLELDYERLYRREAEVRGILKEQDFEGSPQEQFRKKLQRSILEKHGQVFAPISVLEPANHLRDMLFSLPGLLLSERKFELFKTIYLDIMAKLEGGLLPVNYPNAQDRYYGAADLSLLFINLGYTYWQASGDSDFFDAEVLNAYRSIIEAYEKGTSFNIYSDIDGLIFCGDKTTNLSWIPLKTGKGEVLRFGKLLEINALWYNALRIVEFFGKRTSKKRNIDKITKLAEKVGKNFTQLFVNETRFAFYDFILHDYKNEDFRINQIVPLSLPFCPVKPAFAKKVLYRIDEELLTNYGLRSQSRYDASYQQGDETLLQRKAANFYNGAIWPWTISFYTQACLNYKTEKHNFEGELTNFFNTIGELANDGLLGYIPQAVHVNETIRRIGIDDYMPAMANLIWSHFILQKNMQSASG